MHAALAAPYPKKQLDMQGLQPRPAAPRAQLGEAYKRHDLGTRVEVGDGSRVGVVKRCCRRTAKRGSGWHPWPAPHGRAHIGHRASLGREVITYLYRDVGAATCLQG